MRKAIVNFKGMPSGIIEENENGFVFRYDDDYFHDPTQRAISLTLPKTQQTYYIFPSFTICYQKAIIKKDSAEPYELMKMISLVYYLPLLNMKPLAQ
jgi:HipA N-terminal domain